MFIVMWVGSDIMGMNVQGMMGLTLRIISNGVWYIDSDSTATTDTHGSTLDTYGRWNTASERGSWQVRTTRLRHPNDGRHDDDDTERDDT